VEAIIAAENPGGKGHVVGPQLHDMFATHHKVLRRDRITAIMEQMRYSKTKEPHDNVFAIYAILRERGLKIPEPDYKKPVAEVYRETAVAMIQTEGYRDLFLQIGLPKSARISDLSSWVPDWSHNKHVKECNNMLSKHKGATLASGPEFRFDNDHRHLVIPGTTIDTIADRSDFSLLHGHGGLGPDTEEFNLNQKPPPEFWSIFKNDMQSNFTEAAAIWNIRAIQSFLIFAGFPNKKACLEEDTVLFRSLYSMSWDLAALDNDSASLRRLCTLIVSASPSTAIDTSLSKTSSSAVTSDHLLLERDDATKHVPEIDVLLAIRNDPGMAKHYTSISQGLFYQTMFRTAQGHIGIAPYTVEVGDEVSLISGVDCPVIARSQNDLSKLIGLAYIHDYMDGQRWESPSGNHLREIVFV
jgi:hypothetical protein